MTIGYIKTDTTNNPNTISNIDVFPIPISSGGTAATTAENSRINTGAIGILSTTTGINAKSATTTNLYTVPSGKTAIITGAIVRVTAATAFVSTATAGIGVASGESDIFPATALLSLSDTSKMFTFLNNLLGSVMATSTQVIKIGIDVAAVATTLTLSVDLLGYLL